MKKSITLLFVLLAFKSFAQHNVYVSNNGSQMNEDQLRSVYNTVRKTVPPAYDLKVLVYHKVIKNDTIINYCNFSTSNIRSAAKSDSEVMKIDFKQDSTFLLLDQKLPFFKLTDMDGKVVTSNDFLGKPTLINFWAEYCTPCIAEMPDLSRLKERYKDKVNFVSITEDRTQANNLHDFLKDKNFNFQVLQDAEWYKRQLRLASLPRNLFIDKNGILRSIQVNYPLGAKGEALALDNKDNFFVRILDSLIAQAK